MTAAAREIGRLALRVEGDNWCAYYALPNTMEGAISLGSVRMGAVTDRPERKAQFMDLMREIVADILEEKTGVRPEWNDPRGAPEHERSGSA